MADTPSVSQYRQLDRPQLGVRQFSNHTDDRYRERQPNSNRALSLTTASRSSLAPPVAAST